MVSSLQQINNCLNLCGLMQFLLLSVCLYMYLLSCLPAFLFNVSAIKAQPSIHERPHKPSLALSLSVKSLPQFSFKRNIQCKKQQENQQFVDCPQSRTHLLPEFRKGLSCPAFGLTKGSTFPCCSQYCISSLAHCDSFTLWTFNSRRSCSTKVRCDCKSLLPFPEGITADILTILTSSADVRNQAKCCAFINLAYLNQLIYLTAKIIEPSKLALQVRLPIGCCGKL